MIELEEEKMKVKSLTEVQEKAATDDETVKQNMEDEIAKAKGECSKYQQDVAVYEEAIKILQKQVNLLEVSISIYCRLLLYVALIIDSFCASLFFCYM